MVTNNGACACVAVGTKYTYDAVGNPLSVTSPQENAISAGVSQRNTFTADNLISSTATPLTTSPTASFKWRIVNYTYTPSRQKASTDIGRCTTSNVPNCLSHNGATYSRGSVITYSYAPDGLNTDRNGTPSPAAPSLPHSDTALTYDQAGRPTSIADTEPNARSGTSQATSTTTVSGSYYLDGQLRTASDGTDTNTYAYDGAGNTTVRTDHTDSSGITNGNTKTTSYAYNDAGLADTQTTNADSLTTSYRYDDGGRLNERIAKTGSDLREVTVNDYNPDDTIHQATVITGGTTSANPDPIDNPNKNPGSGSGKNPNVTSRYVYTYDNNTNVLTQTVDGSADAYTNNYSYNPAGNLTAFTHAGSAKTFDWDHDSNRIDNKTGGSATTTWTYNLDDSIATRSGTGSGFHYDDAGNLLDGGGNCYTYDGFQRTTSIVKSTDCTAAPSTYGTYTYDGLDRQQQITAYTSGTQRYSVHVSYDGLTSQQTGQTGVPGTGTPKLEILYDLNADGTPQDAGQANTDGSNASTLLLDTDGHGSVSSLQPASATSVSCATAYGPFGNFVAPSGTTTACSGFVTANSLWYRGSREDQTSATYQFGARTYDPVNGAFTTADKWGTDTPAQDLAVGTDPLTANTYTYVNGNPLNFTDPDGHNLNPDNAGTQQCDEHNDCAIDTRYAAVNANHQCHCYAYGTYAKSWGNADPGSFKSFKAKYGVKPAGLGNPVDFVFGVARTVASVVDTTSLSCGLFGACATTGVDKLGSLVGVDKSSVLYGIGELAPLAVGGPEGDTADIIDSTIAARSGEAVIDGGEAIDTGGSAAQRGSATAEPRGGATEPRGAAAEPRGSAGDFRGGAPSTEPSGGGSGIPSGPRPGSSVFRTARSGNGPAELRNGLDPANFDIGDQSAYVGDENAARTLANPKVGGYESSYTRFDMRPEFSNEFSQFQYPYPEGGPTSFEYQIPQELIPRFNDLTISRTSVPFE